MVLPLRTKEVIFIPIPIVGFLKTIFNWCGHYETNCCHWKRFVPGPEFPHTLENNSTRPTFWMALSNMLTPRLRTRSLCYTHHLVARLQTWWWELTSHPWDRTKEKSLLKSGTDSSLCWGLTAASIQQILNLQTSWTLWGVWYSRKRWTTSFLSEQSSANTQNANSEETQGCRWDVPGASVLYTATVLTFYVFRC